MKKRSILSLIVAGLVVLAIFGWPWTLCLLGFLRGEHFYDGRPASYWSWQVDSYANSASASYPTILRGGPTAVPVLRELARDPKPLVRVYAIQTLLDQSFDDEETIRSTIPPLIDLLQRGDQINRCRGAQLLAQMGSFAREAIPALRQAQQEGPDNVYLITTEARANASNSATAQG